ncbi:MAG TPA: hypothetical protein VMG12_25700 [Polyangiaceae bacterium]|nr:hypothetical protein [Polyangiaceae bacterium]
MNRNRLLESLVRRSSVLATRPFNRVAPDGLLGFGRRRRQPPLGWLAVGAAVAGAAALLMSPERRNSLVGLLQRSGGGIGKQLGKFIGEHAGAHPVETARLVQGTRDFGGSRPR